jgi:hypothetical protein
MNKPVTIRNWHREGWIVPLYARMTNPAKASFAGDVIAAPNEVIASLNPFGSSGMRLQLYPELLIH